MNLRKLKRYIRSTFNRLFSGDAGTSWSFDKKKELTQSPHIKDDKHLWVLVFS